MWCTRSLCTRIKIILGIATRCGGATGEPEVTLLTTEYKVFRSQRWNCRMHGDKITSKSWSWCSRNISIKNNSWKSQKQEINKFSEESQQLLVDMIHTDLRTLREFWKKKKKHQCLDCNASTEIGIIYCGCGWNLKYSRSPTPFQKTIAILLQSLTWSLRRIPVEDQNMRSLWCSTKRSRCSRKQDKISMTTIREERVLLFWHSYQFFVYTRCLFVFRHVVELVLPSATWRNVH